MVCTVFMSVQKGIEMKLFRGKPFLHSFGWRLFFGVVNTSIPMVQLWYGPLRCWVSSFWTWVGVVEYAEGLFSQSIMHEMRGQMARKGREQTGVERWNEMRGRETANGSQLTGCNILMFPFITCCLADD